MSGERGLELGVLRLEPFQLFGAGELLRDHVHGGSGEGCLCLEERPAELRELAGLRGERFAPHDHSLRAAVVVLAEQDLVHALGADHLVYAVDRLGRDRVVVHLQFTVLLEDLTSGHSAFDHDVLVRTTFVGGLNHLTCRERDLVEALDARPLTGPLIALTNVLVVHGVGEERSIGGPGLDERVGGGQLDRLHHRFAGALAEVLGRGHFPDRCGGGNGDLLLVAAVDARKDTDDEPKGNGDEDQLLFHDILLSWVFGSLNQRTSHGAYSRTRTQQRSTARKKSQYKNRPGGRFCYLLAVFTI